MSKDPRRVSDTNDNKAIGSRRSSKINRTAVLLAAPRAAFPTIGDALSDHLGHVVVFPVPADRDDGNHRE